jgi:hypothetical protein
MTDPNDADVSVAVYAGACLVNGTYNRCPNVVRADTQDQPQYRKVRQLVIPRPCYFWGISYNEMGTAMG